MTVAFALVVSVINVIVPEYAGYAVGFGFAEIILSPFYSFS